MVDTLTWDRTRDDLAKIYGDAALRLRPVSVTYTNVCPEQPELDRMTQDKLRRDFQRLMRDSLDELVVTRKLYEEAYQPQPRPRYSPSFLFPI